MIKALIKGFYVVFSHLLKKSVTQEYPNKKPILSGYFRGKHLLENCIGCGYCQKVCPSDAITIIKNNNNTVEKYIIDYSKCIFCGNCVYNCPMKAIKMTNNFELATENKSELKQDLVKNMERI